MNEDIDGTGLS